MDKAALCRRISEKLEPNPTYKDYKPSERMVGVDVHIHGMPSELGFWIHSNESVLSTKGGNSGHWMPEGWVAVDFFNDESASARLLDAMPEPCLERYTGAGYDQWGCLYHQAPDETVHTDRKTCIALAAKAWLKIEGEL